tara:strand:+ start:15315 stop:15551 length:237 start_codon:yes stop_codon:yes gene_type:complete
MNKTTFMTQETEKNPYTDIIVDFIKNELLKSDLKDEIMKPLYITALYYVIPLVILLIIMNFITTLIAIMIVFYIKKYN